MEKNMPKVFEEYEPECQELSEIGAFFRVYAPSGVQPTEQNLLCSTEISCSSGELSVEHFTKT